MKEGEVADKNRGGRSVDDDDKFDDDRAEDDEIEVVDDEALEDEFDDDDDEAFDDDEADEAAEPGKPSAARRCSCRARRATRAARPGPGRRRARVSSAGSRLHP